MSSTITVTVKPNALEHKVPYSILNDSTIELHVVPDLDGNQHLQAGSMWIHITPAMVIDTDLPKLTAFMLKHKLL